MVQPPQKAQDVQIDGDPVVVSVLNQNLGVGIDEVRFDVGSLKLDPWTPLPGSMTTKLTGEGLYTVLVRGYAAVAPHPVQLGSFSFQRRRRDNRIGLGN